MDYVKRQRPGDMIGVVNGGKYVIIVPKLGKCRKSDADIYYPARLECGENCPKAVQEFLEQNLLNKENSLSTFHRYCQKSDHKSNIDKVPILVRIPADEAHKFRTTIKASSNFVPDSDETFTTLT